MTAPPWAEPGGWFAPHPDCPEHGRMQPDPAAQPGRPRWICNGYDGEGCRAVVDWTEVDWQPLGRPEFGEFGAAHAAVDLADGESITLADALGLNWTDLGREP
jgi:hypothetical protein